MVNQKQVRNNYFYQKKKKKKGLFQDTYSMEYMMIADFSF